MRKGQEWTSDEPYRLQYHERGADGIVQPNERHFTGKMAFMCYPGRGSQLDHFSTIFIQNEMGHSLGMQCGGYNNAYEWWEMIKEPSTGKPLVGFGWSVGNYLHPNGGAMEGSDVGFITTHHGGDAVAVPLRARTLFDGVSTGRDRRSWRSRRSNER